MRLAWLTDPHLNHVDETVAATCLEEIVAAEPDAVLLGGDIAVAPVLTRWLGIFDRVFPCPVYFVLGNHDYYGGSITEVRREVAAALLDTERLTWLSASPPVPLNERTALVGHGGWGDARYGDYSSSTIRLNDFNYIRELTGLSREALRGQLEALGDEAADHLRAVLPSALEQYERVVVLTHVPPFEEAAKHRGKASTPDYLPFFACRAVGDVLLEMMGRYPHRRMTVLCGHTHSAAEARPLPNLTVRAGAARYKSPAMQAVVELP